MKGLGIVAVFVLALAVCASLGSAAAVINWVNITDKDNFYSNYAGNNVIHVVVNVSGISPTGVVTANFSNFAGTVDCGSGPNIIALNNVTYGDGIYNGSCDVGAEAAGSSFAPISPIIIQAFNETPPVGPPAVDMNLSAVLYNMTVPQMPPSCQRFGPLTTNFTNISDFQRVNFVIHIQNNFTCMVQMLGQQGPPTLSKDYLNVMVMNLTSVNLSTQAQAEKLAQLHTYMNLTIPQPKTFGITRIWINGTGFASLNTNTSIQLLNLPFTSKPNISSDNMSELFDSWWNSSGYDSGFDVVTGNLTLVVLGFTEFLPSDVAKPLIAFTSPVNNTNVSSGTVTMSVLVNGTGTELSYISITNLSGGATYVFNDSSNSSNNNTANCVNMTASKDVRNCTIAFAVSSLSEGANIITVNAWDYGGTSGNTNSSTRTFNVDRTGPAVIVISPGSYTNLSTNLVFNVSSVDALIGSGSCWMTLNNGVNNVTMTKAGNYFNATNASIAAGNYLAKFYCNDTFGNLNGTETLNFTVDATAPTLNSVASSVSSTSATITYAATEDVVISINYGTSTSLGSTSSTSTYSAATSKSLSSLTASTLYYYNVTICDQASNCILNGTTYNFTTSAASGDSGTGDSGDGAAASDGEYWALTWSGNESQMSDGWKKALGLKQRVRFKIGGVYHSVGVSKISSTKVTINVSSEPQSAVMTTGETKSFEVTGDGYYDISVTVDALTSARANLTVKTVHELVPASATNATGAAKNATTAASGNQTTTTAGATETTSNSKRIWIIILVVLVLGLGGWLVYMKWYKPKIVNKSVKVSGL
jgi:hypothetical protein